MLVVSRDIQSKTRGLALIEVLIAASLGLLLLSLLHRFLIPILEAGNRQTVETQFVQQATLVMRRLSLDLRHTSGGGLSFLLAEDTNSSVLAVHGGAGVSARGRRIYDPYLTVYIYDSRQQELKTRRCPPNLAGLALNIDGTHPTLLDQGQLALFLSREVPAKLLADHVVEFEPIDSWPAGPVVRSRIRFSREVPGRTEPAYHEQEIHTSFRN